MINLKNVAAAQAESYYRADDYYTKNSPPAAWHGRGAELLGLSEADADRQFAELLRGKLPTGDEIAGGAGGKRRAGTDLTVSAPKSVSLAALALGDERVVAAHREAAAVAMKHVETLIAARITDKGRVTVERTGVMVAREVLHDTSRAGDPNIHSHFVMLNATQRADGRWVALENREIYRAQHELDLRYKSELALRLAGLGYTVRATAKGFELGEISDAQIRTFSTRKQAVDAELIKRNTSRENSTAKEREIAALATRDPKQIYDRDELAAEWRERALAAGISLEVPTAGGAAGDRREAANKAVEFGVEHLSERESAWTDAELRNAALAGAWGKATFDDISTGLARAEMRGGVVRKLDGTLTTEEAQRREKHMLLIEERGRGAVEAIARDREAMEGALKQTKLNDKQRGAVEAALTTSNRIIGIQGLAGVGKTTLLDEFRRQAEAAGFHLEGVAPSHSAVKALGEAGIQGKTLQSWEAGGGKLDASTVLVVDESSLVSSRQMQFLLMRAEKAGARVLLVGDSGQYQSVEAGKAFHQLQEAGMHVATVDKMLRQQRDELRLVARLAAEGKGAEALQKLGAGVVEIKDRAERHAAIATRFAALSAEDRADCLILTGSNADRQSLNAAVRGTLGLAGTGRDVAVFERGDLTGAEQKRADRYRAGDVIRFEKDYRSLGAAKGDLFSVRAVSGNEITLAAADGREVTVAPGNLSGHGFTVGRVAERELAAGDRVRITGDIRLVEGGDVLRNGQRASVVSISAERMELKIDGVKGLVVVDPRRPLSLDHGYAATGHSAQGLGAKSVILERDSLCRTASQRQFYTDVTRAKVELTVVTDSRAKLEKAVSRVVDKTKALDDEIVFKPGDGRKPPSLGREEVGKQMREHARDEFVEAVTEKVSELVEDVRMRERSLSREDGLGL